ncbi:MAG: hypothetical protein NT060_02295 [Candidatus Omnitrophica bacterium]|nr:hypothetical protein [Candidatus Omnitrophota bacterium]
MKIFIDTASVKEIKEAVSLGVIDGVTTNSSLVAKEARPAKEILKEICAILPGPVSAEVISLVSDGIITEASEISRRL